MHENWDLPLWQGQLRIFRTNLESFKKKLKKKKKKKKKIKKKKKKK